MMKSVTSKEDEFWFLNNEYEILPPQGLSQKFTSAFSNNEETRKQSLIKKKKNQI